MDIKVADNNTLVINGDIKSLDDYNVIREHVIGLNLKAGQQLKLDVPDSMSITSSVIGFLLKVVKKDKINVTITAGDQRLKDLMNDLELGSVFTIK